MRSAGAVSSLIQGKTAPTHAVPAPTRPLSCDAHHNRAVTKIIASRLSILVSLVCGRSIDRLGDFMNASPSTGAGQHLPRLVFWEVTKGCNLRCVHCRATATELCSPNDLPTAMALDIIDQIAAEANPILVLSGGEPLYRADIFQLARYATDKGLRVALATNGTLVTKEVAQKIVDSGVKRVSISLDGSNAETHDSFRGIPGSFDAAVYGFKNLKQLGMPVQINMTIAKHNAVELPKVLEMVRGLGADALHTFLLVPVGCGVDIAESQMVAPEEYERILNWFYDQAAEGGIELKATCAPHYFQIGRRRVG